jgi:predicted metal-dependent phosphoesterase TrpH
MPIVRAELHCHSHYSPDSRLSLPDLIAACEKQGITCVALTDHNTIEGALELHSGAPSWLQVIIAEEVSTLQGDVIGLFLHARIEPGLSMLETIAQIKAQGGIVLLPHPFDRIRKGAAGLTVTKEIQNDIDFIEIFNSRCLIPTDNQRARRYSKKERLLPYVGSDAHTASEYGNANCFLEAFATPEEFRKSLAHATFKTKSGGLVPHLKSHIAKRGKKASA